MRDPFHTRRTKNLREGPSFFSIAKERSKEKAPKAGPEGPGQGLRPRKCPAFLPERRAFSHPPPLKRCREATAQMGTPFARRASGGETFYLPSRAAPRRNRKFTGGNAFRRVSPAPPPRRRRNPSSRPRTAPRRPCRRRTPARGQAAAWRARAARSGPRSRRRGFRRRC